MAVLERNGPGVSDPLIVFFSRRGYFVVFLGSRSLGLMHHGLEVSSQVARLLSRGGQGFIGKSQRGRAPRGKVDAINSCYISITQKILGLHGCLKLEGWKEGGCTHAFKLA